MKQPRSVYIQQIGCISTTRTGNLRAGHVFSCVCSSTGRGFLIPLHHSIVPPPLQSHSVMGQALHRGTDLPSSPIASWGRPPLQSHCIGRQASPQVPLYRGTGLPSNPIVSSWNRPPLQSHCIMRQASPSVPLHHGTDLPFIPIASWGRPPLQSHCIM